MMKFTEGIGRITAMLSIKQKLMGGFVLLLALAAFMVLKTQFIFTDVRQSMEKVANDLQPISLKSYQLLTQVNKAAAYMGFYLSTKQPRHRQIYQEHNKRIQNSYEELLSLLGEQNNPALYEMMTTLSDDLGRIYALDARIHLMATQINKNYNAIAYAADNLNPPSREILQAMSNMVNAESQEAATVERRKLLMDMQNLRYTWSLLMNNVRTYLFFGSDETYQNIQLFVQESSRLVEAIEQQSALLNFEQENAFDTLKKYRNLFMDNFPSLVEIHKSDKARNDVLLIKNELTPLVARIDDNLREIVTFYRDEVYRTSHELLDNTASANRLIIWLFGITVVLGLIIMFSTSHLILSRIRNAQTAMDNISEGERDLTQRLNDHGHDEIALLAKGFNRFMDKIHAIVVEVAEATHQLAEAANEMFQITRETSDSIVKQKADTEAVNRSVDEMANNVQNVAQSTEQAAEAARQADSQALNGKQVVDETIESIHTVSGESEKAVQVIEKLKKETEKIGLVIDVIKSVTEQTNLLALNASIEAARAGEQGRGFAVVADEVRELAEKTRKSTMDIQDMIEKLQKDSGEAVTVMKHGYQTAQSTVDKAAEAGEVLNQVTRTVAKINDMNRSIAEVVEDQTVRIEHINQSIKKVNEGSNKNEENKRYLASRSSELKQLSMELYDLLNKFKM